MDMKKKNARTHSREGAAEKMPKKRTVIVVGASSGIGYETALRLLGRGYAVSNISRTPCPLAQAENHTADVTDGEAFESAIKTICNEREDVFALVYCAGFSMAAPIEYAKEEDYRYLFEVNYFGALRALRAVVPYLKKRGGRVVIVSSLGGTFPIAFDSFYSSSKAAVDMLVRSAALELEPYGIRLCSVRPGGTSTEFTFKRKVYADEEVRDYSSRMRRAAGALAEMEQQGMSAGEVAREIVEAISEKNPPLARACGGKNKLFSAAGKVLPLRASQYIDKKVYRQ